MFKATYMFNCTKKFCKVCPEKKSKADIMMNYCLAVLK